jgi:putative inorganic carbon (hco3(-)) transporter
VNRSPAMRLQLPILRGALPTALAVTCMAFCGALYTLLAYRFSPIVAVAPFVVAPAVLLILSRPMFGVYLGVLATPLEYVNVRLGTAADLSAGETIYLVTAVAFGIQTLVLPRRALAGTHIGFAALIGAAALGLGFAPDKFVVFKVVLTWTAFLALSVLVSREDRQELKWLIVCISAAAGIVSLIAIAGAGDIQLRGGGANASGRAQAGFSSPNLLAFFLVLALCPALALGLIERRWRRYASLAAAGLVFAALMLTLSRGAIIGAMVSLLVMLKWPTFRRILAGLLVAVVVFTALNLNPIEHSREVALVKTRFSTLVSGQEGRTNPRLRIYERVPEMIADAPLAGIGAANFSIVSPSYGLGDLGGDPFAHAHNVPLTIAAETGLIGLAAFLAFVLGLARNSLDVLRARGQPDYGLGVALVAALAGLFANSMTDYPLRANPVMAVLMLEVGAVLAYARLAGADGREPRRSTSSLSSFRSAG